MKRHAQDIYDRMEDGTNQRRHNLERLAELDADEGRKLRLNALIVKKLQESERPS